MNKLYRRHFEFRPGRALRLRPDLRGVEHDEYEDQCHGRDFGGNKLNASMGARLGWKEMRHILLLISKDWAGRHWTGNQGATNSPTYGQADTKAAA